MCLCICVRCLIIKSLIFSSRWSHIYLLIKDARSLDDKQFNVKNWQINLLLQETELAKFGARNFRVSNTIMADKVNFIYFKQMKTPTPQPLMKRQIIQIVYDTSRSVTKCKHTLHKVQRRMWNLFQYWKWIPVLAFQNTQLALSHQIQK